MADEPILVSTDINQIPEIVGRVRAGFKSHVTLDYDYRMRQLHSLKRLLEENEERLLASIKKDLNKSKQEAYFTEFSLVMGDLVNIMNNLADWMAPCHKPKDLMNKFNSVYVQPEPYGVVLNIVPWNYPLQLLLLPLVGIIAAGNCCILKPSEYAVTFSNLIAELIPQYLDPECYAVVTGALEQCKALMKERFDYIMFTGASAIGKLVMKEAATTLTPVLMELGGKCPAIVAKDANVDVSARRIMWGRCLNAGQTCIAPDYVLCTKEHKDRLAEACKKTVENFYGKNPKDSPDYGRIIHSSHFQRVTGLIKESKGTVVYGGDNDPQTRYIQPTILTDITPDDKLMQEEIFGPVLPIMTVDSVDDAIEYVNSQEKPLALYIFTENKATFERVTKLTSAGGVTHNDVILHAGASLPFGGVGNSGCGAYHGKYSFDSFSHLKPILSTGTGLEALNSVRYPPYNQTKLNRLRWVLFWSSGSSVPWKMIVPLVSAVIIAALVKWYGLPSWPQSH